MKLKITQSQLDLLLEIKEVALSGADKLISRKVNDEVVILSEQQKLIMTRPKGKSKTYVEVAFDKLGWEIAHNEVEHEVVSDQVAQNDVVATEDVPAVDVSEQVGQVAGDVPDEVENHEEDFQSVYVIEDDVPLPKVTRKFTPRKRRVDSIPVDQMEVGQSVRVPYRQDGHSLEKELSRIRQKVSHAVRRYCNGKSVKFKTYDEDGKSARVYRVA